MQQKPEALLVTGLYGAGKSSLVEELADRLERLDVSYGAIDVDWLSWMYLPPDTSQSEPEIWVTNLADVSGRYLAAGVRYLLLAHATRHNDDVQQVRDALACPLRVVRLDTPWDVIESRLRAAPTTGRSSDLAVARRWVDEGWGTPDAELVLDGANQLSDLASHVLIYLGI